MNQVSMQLLVAAFEQETGAEEALKALRASRDEELIGIQAAVAMRKDDKGQIHFKDVGLTPEKGVLGGVVLGAVVGILTGGTGLALGAVGAVIGGLVGKKKREGRFSADRINQVAASLAPGSSAVVIVMEPGWVVAMEEQLELLGADVLTASIPAEVAAQIGTQDEATLAALEEELDRAVGVF